MQDKPIHLKGCFVVVVGPSGAGKDTLMDAARAELADDVRFHFVRRVITRPQMPGTEDHDSLDEAGFIKAQGEDAFALDWQAHGLHYGLPKSLDVQIENGKVVIANISRRVLADVRRLYPSHAVVLITARQEVLAKRLAARGRETREQIEQRLLREVRFDDQADNVVTLDNSEDVETSITDFVNILIKITKTTY
ncbi:phosphonate metabolism protein/1,5-bisphosphokinase (PRPP-forming) PhnN [Brucella sp. BE17]|uniref:phosphonate metabolism protein/1,5-bisphosphokinase (PRPP-forming) PhnN n=1 Tax=Brucella sp. BE17 TaxID=3142977 RepID=UPI0031BAD775